MSRLDSMHRRLAAQIDGLNWAAAQAGDLNGDVLEIGLGNGRTYDHLRELLPDRRIWVIDRAMNAHPSCVPPPEDFLRGEADAMLEKLARSGARMALIHYELGVGDDSVDRAESARLSPLIHTLALPGALIVSQQALPDFSGIDGPESVAPERYLFYRA